MMKFVIPVCKTDKGPFQLQEFFVESIEDFKKDHRDLYIKLQNGGGKKIRKVDDKYIKTFLKNEIYAEQLPEKYVLEDGAKDSLSEKHETQSKIESSMGLKNDNESSALSKSNIKIQQNSQTEVIKIIVENITNSLEAALKEHGTQVQTVLNELASTMRAGGIEILATQKATELATTIEKEAKKHINEFAAELNKLKLDTIASLEEVRRTSEEFAIKASKLENLKGDIEEDTSDLWDRIKKYGLGHVQILEQEKIRLENELSNVRQSLDKANTDITTLKVQSGGMDPILFRDALEKSKRVPDLEYENSQLQSEKERWRKEREDYEELKKTRRDKFDKEAELNNLQRFHDEYELVVEKLNQENQRLKDSMRRLEKDYRVLQGEYQSHATQFEQIESISKDRDQNLRRADQLEKDISSIDADIAELRAHNVVLASERDDYRRKFDAGEREYKQRMEIEFNSKLNNSRNEIEDRIGESYRDNFKRLEVDLENAEELKERQISLAEERRNELIKLTDELKNTEITLVSLETIKNMNYPKLYDELKSKYEKVLAENRTEAFISKKIELQEQIQADLLRLETLKTTIQVNIDAKAVVVKEKATAEGELLCIRKQVQDALDQQVKEEEMVQQRAEEIFKPLFSVDKKESPPNQSEWTWLDSIEEHIKSSGFRIGPRLLHAFHTSLKSQDISPLTLLMGISGTGKSELPRIYADAGGLYFLNVSVQPNWDNPSDLFGFYNYAERHFRHTPLTQAMLQFVSSSHGKPKLHNRLLLVLLDEMNLARVEYYFSDLLSRLESRRAVLSLGDAATKEQRRRASIELDLGRERLEFFLGANVLFVGTLNQDESTLDVSDKVIDRANTITFPRPTHFVNLNMAAKNREEHPSLVLSDWEEWCQPDDKHLSALENELAEEFSKINSALAKINRGIGQRVFQAVLRYLSLYPCRNHDAKTRAASLKKAKADQYAMKIIPKLKGLPKDIKGAKSCLDDLGGILPDELQPEFNAAREREVFEWHGSSQLYATND